MPMEDFQILGDLGKGSFGCVVKCMRKSDKQLYAMKQVNISAYYRSNYRSSNKKIKWMHSMRLDF